MVRSKVVHLLVACVSRQIIASQNVTNNRTKPNEEADEYTARFPSLTEIYLEKLNQTSLFLTG